jgi:uncharacterized protein YfaS (alpha-2-macroglobulin family)
MLWASAYGGLVLGLARQHGADVPETEFGQLHKFLSEQLRSMGSDPGELSDFPLALYALAVAGRAEPAYCEKLYALHDKLSVENRALLALASLESGAPVFMSRELLTAKSNARHAYDDFDCSAREQAIRLLAWMRCVDSSPRVSRQAGEDPLIESLVTDLTREAQRGHWGTTQGDAWAMLALTEYTRTVEAGSKSTAGRLEWQGHSVPFQLEKGLSCFSTTFPLADSGNAPLMLYKEPGTRLFANVTLEARSPVAQQPRQDRGFGLQRRYERLDDDNRPWPLDQPGSSSQSSLRVGDRVLVTLRLAVREPARYVAVDDALPSILEAVNPEFKTQAARGSSTMANSYSEDGDYWVADFREIRKDRFLSFANRVSAGTYTLRYVARVRAAGAVTAPSAKVEEMYHPERYGLSETVAISSVPVE